LGNRRAQELSLRAGNHRAPGGHHLMATLGIVIVSYRSEHEVQGLLEALGGELWKDAIRVVVVSNSGDCGQLACPQQVTVITMPHNVGFARACNAGAAALDTEFIAFCNPDLRITSEALLNLCRLLTSRTDYQILSPHYGSNALNQPTGTITEARSLVAGACMVMRRTYFQLLDGWEESFFLWGEDRDLCTRVWRRGERLGWADGIVAVHTSGHSVEETTRAQQVFLTRAWVCSQTNFRLRNFGMAAALTYLVGMCVVNSVRAISGRRAPLRSYSDPATAAVFGLRTLCNTWRLSRYVSFDGETFAWGRPPD
jgi:GT2 family glycosyltransferase